MILSTEIEINHPIFGEKCFVYIEGEGKVIPANYEDGYLESPGVLEVDSMEVLEINNKKYSKSVIKSMANFLKNHYSEEIQESFLENEY